MTYCPIHFYQRQEYAIKDCIKTLKIYSLKRTYIDSYYEEIKCTKNIKNTYLISFSSINPVKDIEVIFSFGSHVDTEGIKNIFTDISN